MSEKKGVTYKDAGVDVEAGYKAVELMKKHVKTTFDSNVLMDIGSFGGLYSIANSEELSSEPVLVAGTDGVGTKLRYAFVLDRHDTVGIDCVAMCVNDVVCQGARPLLFLDYFATGKLRPETAATVVSGIAEGCRQAGCALIGGETAEMPGFYGEGEYDMAGFSVGIASKSKLITPQRVEKGNLLIGVSSSGIHSNGFSLVRKVLGEDKSELLSLNKELNQSLADVLLTPTKIYVKPVLELIKNVYVRGVAHITGGGFIENIPRILQKGQCARIDLSSYSVPKIFSIIKERAGITTQQIYNTLNMGIGMVIAVAREDAEKALAVLTAAGESARVIGEVEDGEGVRLI